MKRKQMNPPWQVQQPSLMSDGRLHSVSKLSRILPFLLPEHRTHKHTTYTDNRGQCMFVGGWGLPVWSWEGGTTRWLQWPSWSSSGARSWPCCIYCCSRKHLRSEGHTGENPSLAPNTHWKLQNLIRCSYLDSHRVNCPPDFKASFLEHHDRSVVDASSCDEVKVNEPQTHHRIPVTADSDLQEISGWEVWSWLRREPSACRQRKGCSCVTQEENSWWTRGGVRTVMSIIAFTLILPTEFQIRWPSFHPEDQTCSESNNLTRKTGGAFYFLYLCKCKNAFILINHIL